MAEPKAKKAEESCGGDGDPKAGDMEPVNASVAAASKTAEEVLQEQGVHPDRGLDASTASARQRVFGPNEFAPDDPESMLSKFIEQFKQPLILLLLGSAIISVVMGQYDDAISITLAITIVR